MANLNSNERAWDEMNYATRDATNVALMGDTDRIDKDDIHTMLMVAGMTPGIGNIADAADAVMYAFEDEFGEAAWSAAAMIPFIGQWVSAKRALHVARKAGKTKKLYRGTTDWHRGEMVKERMHVSPGNIGKYSDLPNPSKKGVWATDMIEEAQDFRQRGLKVEGLGEGPLLEYEVPEEWYNEHLRAWSDSSNPETFGKVGWFKGGIPAEFLIKVTKGSVAP